jgi:phosphoesterase RecJ-like protein
MTVDLRPYASAVPDTVVERMSRARHVLAVSHENPDADTLGAVLAIVSLTEHLGGRGTAVCTDPVPGLYGFMPGIDRFRTDPDPSESYDLLVVCDCGALDRVGDVARRHPALFAELPRVVIDHHVSNGGSGDDDWVDATSAATCEMVTLLAVRLGIPLGINGGDLAANLMAGIVMDTATFAHPNATPRTLATSAALVEAGAPLSDISRRLYRTKPDAQLKLFGLVLGRLGSIDHGRIIFSSLLEADHAAAGTIPAHSEGLIDLLSQSETADVAILFKENGSSTRISVRTRPEGPDATVLTGLFGGGGHARAAGATIEAPLDEARAVVLARAAELLTEGQGATAPRRATQPEPATQPGRATQAEPATVQGRNADDDR